VGGVEDHLVGMGGFLSVWVRSRGGEIVCKCLEGRWYAVAGEFPGGDCSTSTVWLLINGSLWGVYVGLESRTSGALPLPCRSCRGLDELVLRR
jgi:hypothetical protein